MAIDVTGLILVILFFIKGYSRGLVVALFSFIAIFLGITLSLKFSHALAEWLLAKGWVNSGWALVLSYVIMFTAVVLLVRIVARLIQKSMEMVMLGMLNRIGGGVLYVLLGAILWSTLLWLGEQLHVITSSMTAGSMTFAFFTKLAPILFSVIGHLLPFVKDLFINLQHFFDHVNQNHVGAH